jgi:hypothetical protein
MEAKESPCIPRFITLSSERYFKSLSEDEKWVLAKHVCDMVKNSITNESSALLRVTEECVLDSLNKRRAVVVIASIDNLLTPIGFARFFEYGQNTENGNISIEVGTLIVHPDFRGRNNNLKNIKTSGIASNRSLAVQLLSAVIYQIKNKYPNFHNVGEIVAFARSVKSRNCLEKVGFKVEPWTDGDIKIYCTDACLGVKSVATCPFRGSFEDGACLKMVYPIK